MRTDMKKSTLKPNTVRQVHGGFTLVELLLVIAIIAVLSSMAVGVIAGAQNDARVAATRSRVQVIEKLMQAELEDFEVRRSPLPFRFISSENTIAPFSIVELAVGEGLPPRMPAAWNPAAVNRGLHARNMKRLLVLDLIRSEYPDFTSGTPLGLGTFPSIQFQQYLTDPPSSGGLGMTAIELNTNVLPFFARYQTANVLRWTGWGGALNGPNDANSAEVLYRILSELEVDGVSGMDVLGGSRATADTDGDGFLEVVDAWGDPIAFQFHQQLIYPLERDPSSGSLPLQPWMPNRSGRWKDSSLTAARTTDFTVILPVLPSDVKFFASSANLLEVDGSQPEDFVNPSKFF